MATESEMGCSGSKADKGGGGGAAKSTTQQDTGGVKLAAAKEGGFARHQFIATNKGKLDDHYAVQNTELGKGTYGSVTTARNKATNALRAVKTIKKKDLGADTERFMAEIAIMRMLDHPNIIKLYETFEDARNIYLVMELCTGGELFDRIVDSETGFSEKVAAKLVRQILQGLFYMHKCHIAHRDLKPENFLMQNEKHVSEAPLKIIDFGLSKQFEVGVPMQTKACTPYYVAPEVLQGSYNELCDVWSVGVIIYVLLCGAPPFYGDTDNEVLKRVRTGEYDFDVQGWEVVSNDAKDLIRKMLVKNVKQRYTAEQALHHPWVEKMAPNATGQMLSQQAFNNLKKFRSQNKLKKAALTVIAQQLSEDNIKQLKEMFQALDADGDGTLTVEEMRAGIEKLGEDVPADLQRMMEEVDSDGSGVIDYTEFLAATLDKRQYIQEDVCWAAFRVFDLDGNGKITKEELAQVLHGDGDTAQTVEGVLGKNAEEIEQIIKDADVDGDGELDFDEFMAMMRKG